MRVGIYSGSPSRVESGLHVYNRNLIDHLRGHFQNKDISIINTMSRHSLRPSTRSICGDARRVQLLLPERLALYLWNRTNLFPLDMLERYDVIHSTMSFLPPVRNARTIVTVHDLIPLARPDISLLSTEKAKLISRSVLRADLVIADSEYTKCDITKYLGIDPSKVSVIYPGVDPVFESDVAESTVKETMNKYSIDFPYLLFVGNIDPRKNLARLIRAFGRFARTRDCRERLLLVGGITHRSAEVLSIIAELGLQDKVRHLGYVPRADMPALFMRAEIFVFPSIYEGFGFPVLEAMSCGVPVITTNTSSLPEIAGDAAYYVSPDSVESISAALDVVSSNARLRKEMTRKGRVRACRFRWEDTARQTAECYRKVFRA